MFNHIEGTIENKFDDSICLNTNLGLGVLVFVSDVRKFKTNSKCKLYINEFIKDEQIFIYGFKTIEELNFFNLLVAINGIGPKTALTILKNIDINHLIFLITNRMFNELRLISGIGSKAEKIVFELKDKIGQFDSIKLKYNDVYLALKNLGYKDSTIFNSLNKLKNGLSNSEALKICIEGIKNEKQAQ